jgi:hypothetical protein
VSGPIDPVPLLRRLADAGVLHVVIGGFAVVAHGVLRVTKDLDICPDPAPDNLERLAAFVAGIDAVQLGTGEFDADEMPLDPTSPDDLAEGGNFRLQSPLGALDVMQWVPGIDADQAFATLAADAVAADVDGVPVRISSLVHLRAMKRAAGRPQDLQDLADLAIAHGGDD